MRLRGELIPFRLSGPAARDAVCLALRDGDGLVGLGEAAPIETSSYDWWGAAGRGQTLEHCKAALLAAIASLELDLLDRRAAPLAIVNRTLAPHEDRLAGSPSARFALETALLDLLAQRRGTDLCGALRDPDAPDDPARALPIGALVPVPAGDPAFLGAANEAIARGFRVLKVKLTSLDDAALEREIEGLTALRRAAPDIELRLDPNARWDARTAPLFLRKLAVVGPSYVEQPVGFEDLEGLHATPVPWAADEEVGEPRSQRFLRRDRGCSAYVLKPAHLGIARTLEQVAIARSMRPPIDVVVTHFMDGPVGLAAACEVALSIEPPPLPCGLDRHPGLTEGALARPGLFPHHRAPTAIRRTGQLGLGLDREVLLEALRVVPASGGSRTPGRAT